MAAWYPWVVLVHVSCAIVFVGAVVFEVAVLEGLHAKFEPDVMHRIEAAIMERARKFMPVVVVLLFLSGFFLFDYRCNGFACVATTGGKLLLVKVALAFAVLAVFARAIWAGLHGGMDPCRFRNTHRIILAMMVAIVVIAKLMFSGVF
ncbi:MAG: hypothetical protein EPN72_03500 [Nevskiaceae bacterium]|nr:MAG: hypothetical protein EPN63_06280 [Nevskiaceae bacterium]TBR73897.1 MAG: hypothetical protein EPN72_03500 [Nevskiaceae bacterium]